MFLLSGSVNLFQVSYNVHDICVMQEAVLPAFFTGYSSTLLLVNAVLAAGTHQK